jgi:protein TonB
MSNDIYIHDDFGNQIPLLDNYGNLSFEVIMLYSEDKLTAADRKAVDDFAATDEMSKDTLDGYALTTNSSKTRHQLGQVNAGIQKITGAKAISNFTATENEFDYRKLAATIVLIMVVAGGTYLGSRFFNNEEITDSTVLTEEPLILNEVAREYSTETLQTEDEFAERGSVIEEEPATNDLKSLAEEQSVEVEEVAESEFDLSLAVASKNKAKPENSDATLEAIHETVSTQIEYEADALQDDQILGSAQDNMDVVEAPENKGLDNEEMVLFQHDLVRHERLAATSEEEESTTLAAKMVMTDMERAGIDEAVVIENQKSDLKKKATESGYAGQAAQASFPGGDLEMYKFIEKSKQYTEAMIEEGLKGVVVVSFQIDKNGKVSKVKVKSGQQGWLAQDAVQVIESMPKWEPAKKANGSIVKSERVVTIRYGD